MRRRVRKFIGAGVMLAFVGVYAVSAMLVAQSDPVHRLPAWGQSIFYAIVGLAWILPIMPLLTWMERPDRGDPEPGTF